MSGRIQPPGGLYLVTDPGLSMNRIGCDFQAETTDTQWHQRAIAETVQVCKNAADAGFGTVQLRWKNVDARYFYELAGAVAEELRTTSARIVINDRIDVFLAARNSGITLDGVHIGQTDLSPQATRELIGPHALLGLSAATEAEIRQAHELGDVVDWIGVGAVHSTETKKDAPPPLGIDGTVKIAAESTLAVTAIGGIHVADVQALAGRVHSIAVVSAVVCAPDTAAAAQELVAAWDAGCGASSSSN